MYRRVIPNNGAALDILYRSILSLLVPICSLAFPTSSHSEQSYLDAIEIEAEKLDDSAAHSEGKANSPSTTVSDDSREKFEQELESRYRGTYLFYKQLPARSREEVFLEHEQGASIEDVRKTILNRYLHSH